MLVGAGVLFALVMVLFALVIWWPGWGSRVSPGRWIVLGGLILPAVVLPPLIAYHMPAGTPVDILVTSQDVIHAFWIPRFAGKIDAVPGHVNRLRIQADQPGRYAGQCNEFCGLGHAGMRFDVIVHRPEEFAAALAQAAASGEPERK